MTPEESFERSMYFRGRALEQDDDNNALTWILMAKSVAVDAGLVELACDLMADVGDIRDRINKRLKKSGKPAAPINTFAACSMSRREFLKHI